MKTRYSSERGQVLVIIVIAMFGLIGMTGLAIDGSRAYSDRRKAQNAADTASMAAALSFARNQDDTQLKEAGWSRAGSNGYDNNGITNEVMVNHPPNEDSVYYNNGDYVQVVITSHLDTFFGGVIGINQVTNTVQAVAKVDPSVPSELYSGNAVVGLAPNECQAVKWQGTADGDISGGGIFVNSDCDASAFFNNSSAAKLKAPSLTVVGGADYKDDAIDIGTITEDSQYQAMSYPPLEYILPMPECKDNDGHAINATVNGETMKPGNWSGKFPPAGVKYLDPGFYCVNSGDFKLNAGDYLEGHNVLIVIKTGKVTWNGGATIKVFGKEDEPYKGFLLYLPVTNSSAVTINGDSDSEIEGTILAPASPITINGTGSSGITGQIIGYTVDLGGSGGVKIQYDDEKVLHLLTSPSIEMME